jgi:hypothetical protein
MCACVCLRETRGTAEGRGWLRSPVASLDENGRTEMEESAMGPTDVGGERGTCAGESRLVGAGNEIG